MHIVDRSADEFIINIFSDKSITQISFCTENKVLKLLKDDELSKILKDHLYQLKKILRNKRKDTFYIGFKLTFVLRDNQEVIKMNDLSNLIVYDTRKETSKLYTKEYYESEILNIFTDGGFSEKKQLCSFVVLSKTKSGLYNITFGVKNVQNSSLIEMIAVIEALKKFKNETEIRIITDSRYVIKGLTEWMFNWRLNNWYTAQGEKVKNIRYWEEYDYLTKGKYIEYQWVKAHSFHFENTICDHYASELLKRS